VPGFGVIMPLGPGDRELERAADVLDSLFTYEPGCGWVVLIDDVKVGRGLETRFPCPPGCTYKVFVNPRQGKGHGWSGGMSVGVAAAVRWLARETDAPFALRLDTDSLVVAPFAAKIASFFASDPRIGLAGSFRRFPNGGPRIKQDARPMLEDLIRRISFKRRFPFIRRHWALFGRAARRRALILEAVANGYQLGENCQGGGYAISRTLLNCLRESSALDDVFLFRNTRICEDIMMSIFCQASNLQMSDFNRDHEPFAVMNGTLIDAPAKILARGYSIIHSLKDPDRPEDTTRAFFRAERLRAKN
jgi:hypothetical protein